MPVSVSSVGLGSWSPVSESESSAGVVSASSVGSFSSGSVSVSSVGSSSVTGLLHTLSRQTRALLQSSFFTHGSPMFPFSVAGSSSGYS